MTDKPSFVYTVYIESTPEKVWEALTDPAISAEYWGHSNVSDWQVGSPWQHVRVDGSGESDVDGFVLESEPPRRLVTSWGEPGKPDGPFSKATFTIQEYGNVVRLTVTHEDLADESELRAATGGWSAVLSNLKTLLETGKPLSKEPWLMS